MTLGKDYFSKGLASYLKLALVDFDDDQEIRTSKPIEEVLSVREEEILNLMVKGLNNQEVSLTLGITIRTVKFHTSNILHKIGVKSRAKAIAAWTFKNEDEKHKNMML